MNQVKRRISFQPREYLTQLYLTILFSIFILYTGNRGYEYISVAKYRVTVILSGGYIITMSILQFQLVLIGSNNIRLRNIWKSMSWTQRFVVLYLAFTMISALLSPYKESWFGMSRNEGFWTIAIYCVSFLYVSFYGRPQPWMIFVFGGAMTIFCFISILQFLGFNPFYLYPQNLTWYDADIAYSGAYFGTIGNADSSSALLCLAVPIFWVAMWKGKRKRRWFLLIPCVLSILVLLWCKVAAGYVAILGSCLLLYPILTQEKDKKRIRWELSLSVLVCGLFIIYLWEPSGGSLYELHEVLHGNIEETFGSGRIYIWNQVLQRIPENLLFGTGPDTMAAAGIEGFSYYNQIYDKHIQILIDLAHNEYLNILYHQGLFAFLTYIVALGCTVIEWIKNGKKCSEIGIFGSGILGYSIQVFFSFSACVTAPLFWGIWALIDHEIRLWKKG